MTVITRYFGPTSAGTGDGTSYSNRAALFVGGDWSTVITGFNFTGNSLNCLVEAGSYTMGQSLSTGLFANPPTTSNRLAIVAANEGVRWTVPNWHSSMPRWSDANMPRITATTSVTINSVPGLTLFGLALYWSGGTTIFNALSGHFPSVAWCIMENTFNNTNSCCLLNPNFMSILLTNCVMSMPGTNFFACVQTTGGFTVNNCRFIGNRNATSGNRHGITTASNVTAQGVDCCFAGFAGGAIAAPNTGGASAAALRCTINNCATGVLSNGTTGSCLVKDCFITNCNTGVSGAGTVYIERSRLRNTVNWSSAPEVTSEINFIDSGSDAAEYVNVGTNDLSIRSDSIYWGRGIGSGDQVSTAGGFSLVKRGGLVF